MGGCRLARAVLAGVVCALAATSGYAAEPEQFFASVFLDKKKIGQFHVRMTRAETGEIEELRARASVSMLGINLYEFTQDLTQTWQDGALQGLQGRADDNGKIYDLELARQASDYGGSVNGESVSLPAEAFPNSIWHYGILDHDLLFNEIDLQLLHVTIKHATETIALNKRKIPAERVTISGDFDASTWFDQDKNFLMAELKIGGRKVAIRRDP